MANYYSTSDLVEVVKGQVVKTVGDNVDSVIRFHGNLTQVVQQHFAQAAGNNIQVAVVISLLDGVAAQLAGDGTPLYLDEVYDLFVIARAKRGDYDEASERLMNVVDKLTWEIFECNNKGDMVKERIAAHRFVRRVPRIIDDPNLMAYSVQWQIKPRQTP